MIEITEVRVSIRNDEKLKAFVLRVGDAKGAAFRNVDATDKLQPGELVVLQATLEDYRALRKRTAETLAA